MEDGLLKEIQHLLDEGISFDDQSMRAIGYKEFRAYFNGEKCLEECVEEVKINSRHFAKRQYTFFNHQMDVHWHDNTDEAMEEVRRWLT
jgi:tRNA dimethylallyltransferase